MQWEPSSPIGKADVALQEIERRKSGRKIRIKGAANKAEGENKQQKFL